MKAIKFPECNVEVAKNQREYKTLYAYQDKVVTISCYKLSFFEKVKVIFTGKIWISQMNFGNPLQPQRPSVHRKHMFEK